MQEKQHYIFKKILNFYNNGGVKSDVPPKNQEEHPGKL